MFADLKDKLASKKAELADAPLAGGLKEKLAGLDKKRLYTAVAALVIAGAAGHFMQQGANSPAPQAPQLAASEYPAAPEVEAAAPAPVELAAAPAAPSGPTLDTLAAAPEIAPLPMAPEVTRSASEPLLALAEAPTAPGVAAAVDIGAGATPAALPDLPIELAAVTDFGSAEREPFAPTPVDGLADTCAIEASATPMPGALVALTVSAPCNSGEEVEFGHAGLRFSEQLGPDGGIELMVPAMTADAVFTVAFANGQQVSAEASVADIADYERVALVWHGATGLQLHAMENGATYGEPGHVWAEAPGAAALATEGKGGFVSVLGSTATGYAADVYTYPESLMPSSAGPEVSIEAQVMENTCGSKIEGLFLRSEAGRAPMETNVSMAVPACDAVGEYLVLKNLPQDLKIARN